MTRCATRSFPRLNVPTFQRSNEDLWALKDVSFDVKQGEVVGIPSTELRAASPWDRTGIGRNGAGTLAPARGAAVPGAAGHAGESTLLKILSRITEPTSGRSVCTYQRLMLPCAGNTMQ
jgi:lipopolysaccharide transport system ATP-binding protein